MQSDHLDVLVRLGLNSTEAKIFLALCNKGTSTARMIAENAGVAREVVYQTIPTLQERGLTETVMDTPKVYKAISVDLAYEILLKRNTEENNKLKKEAHKSIQALKKKQKEPSEESAQITIVPCGKALISKVVGEIKLAKRSIDIITTWTKISKLQQFQAQKEIELALRRNVKFRILLEEPISAERKNVAETLSLEPSYVEYINFRIKPMATLVNMIIIDDKKALMDITVDNTIIETPLLYSSNLCLAQVATQYFQNNWDTAKIPFKETEKETKKGSPMQTPQICQ